MPAGGGYLLTVSTLEPRKNLPRLLDAHALALPRLPEPWPLVVVGPAGWGPALAPRPSVLLAGHVAGGVLSALYDGARLVAYVPLREGWGLPAVEAMACGTPVVATPMPSTGGAACEVPPADVEAIADALVAVATDEALRARLVDAGPPTGDGPHLGPGRRPPPRAVAGTGHRMSTPTTNSSRDRPPHGGTRAEQSGDAGGGRRPQCARTPPHVIARRIGGRGRDPDRRGSPPHTCNCAE